MIDGNDAPDSSRISVGSSANDSDVANSAGGHAELGHYAARIGAFSHTRDEIRDSQFRRV